MEVDKPEFRCLIQHKDREFVIVFSVSNTSEFLERVFQETTSNSKVEYFDKGFQTWIIINQSTQFDSIPLQVKLRIT